MRIAWLGALVAGFTCVGIAAAAGPLRVAMLPVVVNSNDSETGYLSRGIADMLSARLERSGEIAIVRLEDGSTDQETAVEAASEVNASFVVFGSYTQFGDGASLDLRCAPVDGVREEGARRVFIQAGSPGEIIPKLDDLSVRVTRYLVGAAVSAPPVSENSTRAATKPATQSTGDLQRRVAELERVIFNRTPSAEPSAR
ncbi:MAG: hypothetical protein VCE43_05835 [Myxococcota bacterium]